MPALLDALERFIEEAIEGTAQRLFRTRLQPIQLAKAALRRMERGQVVGPSGLEVPNHFVIALHPRDYEQFARYVAALQQELARYLERAARERGWRPVGKVTVLLERDESAAAGRPRVAATMDDVEPLTGAAAAGGELAGQTIVRPAPRQSPPAAIETPPCVLLQEDGARFELRRSPLRIGRALDNDVVLADPRVSRFHAEIRHEDGRYVLYDLGSTNGTLVDGRAVERCPLRDGAEIMLGGSRLTFRES